MVRNDKVLEGMARDFFPKDSIAYNACIEGAAAIKKVNNLSNDTKTITLGEYQEYCLLKVRYLQEKLITYHGDSIDWAVYTITRFLNDYLKEKGVDDSTSLTEKRMFTIGFAHRVEEGLLDYLEKLEEFNS